MVAIAVLLSITLSACMTVILVATITGRIENRMARIERRQRLLALLNQNEETPDR